MIIHLCQLYLQFGKRLKQNKRIYILSKLCGLIELRYNICCHMFSEAVGWCGCNNCLWKHIPLNDGIGKEIPFICTFVVWICVKVCRWFCLVLLSVGTSISDGMATTQWTILSNTTSLVYRRRSAKVGHCSVFSMAVTQYVAKRIATCNENPFIIKQNHFFYKTLL